VVSGSFFNALLKDPVISRLSGKNQPSSGGKLPENLVARVLSLKGDLSVLKWQGGVFTATLNASVTPGETLLLKYNGLKGDRSHYRIMARFPTGLESESSSLRNAHEPFLFGLLPPSRTGEQNQPALIRFLPPREGKATNIAGDQDPLLELMIDTDSFGLVMVRFFYHRNQRMECQFVVESQEAGVALQNQAKQLIVEAGGNAEEQAGEPLRLVVDSLQKDIAMMLHKSGFSLNVQA